jgi:25S rRNA (uracil2634-N3)-methyltransferase
MADKQAGKQVDFGKGEDKEKWVKHYSSKHQILLVGEGDFSFSWCLARSFGSGSKIVASSLDSYGNLSVDRSMLFYAFVTYIGYCLCNKDC